MGLLTKEVVITCRNYKKHYISKGYNWEYNKQIIVKVEDLPKGSNVKVEVLCDYCLEEVMKKEYSTFIKQRENSTIHKDCCKKCSILKVQEGNLVKYGAESTFQLPEVREKRKITMLNLYGAEEPSSSKILQEKRLKNIQDKYGVDNVFQINEVKQKRKISMEEKYGNKHALLVKSIVDKKDKTMLDNFGVKYPIQNEDIKDKIKNTNLERYGTKYPLENEDIKEKARNTCLDKYGVNNFASTEEYQILTKNTMLDKYGVEYPMQNKDILTKARETMYRNGTAPRSKQQEYICQLLNGELNYPIDNISLDIAFPDEKIYIEYDGGGHDLSVKIGSETQEQFNKRNIKRYYYLRENGWKEIRIISKNDYLPLDEIIIKIIKYAKEYLNTGHSWIEFNVDNQTIKTSIFEEYFDFGKLHKIKNNDLIETYHKRM